MSRIVSLLCLFFSSQLILIAQWDDFQFSHIGMENGLTSQRINDIAQDDQGYLYLAGEQGLMRYDGSSIKSFYHDAQDSNSLERGELFRLYFDSTGSLWILARKTRLLRFDPKTHHVDRHPLPVELRARGNVYAFHIDNRQHIWLGYDSLQLAEWDPETGKILYYRPDTIPFDAPPTYSHPMDMIQDVDNPDVYWISSLTPGLVKFNKEENSFDLLQVEWASDKLGKRIVQDQNGIIYGSTWSEGFYAFDPEKETFTEVLNNLGPGFNTLRSYEESIIDPEKNLLWVTSGRGKLIRYLPGDGDYSIHEVRTQEGKPAQYTMAYFDKEKNLWLGGWAGLGYLRRDHQYFHYYDVSEPHHLAGDRAWPAITTFDEKENVIYFKGRNTKFLYLIPAEFKAGGKSNMIVPPLSIQGMHTDEKGRFWIADEGGLYQWDRMENKLLPFHHPTIDSAFASDFDVFGIEGAGNGNIVLKGYQDMLIIQPDQNHVSRLRDHLELWSPEGGNMEWYRRIIREKNSIWIKGNTLIRYYLETGKWKRYNLEGIAYNSGSLTSMAFDQEGAFWISSFERISKYKFEDDSFHLVRNYTINDGLASNWAYVLTMDDKGRIWTFGSNGMSSIDPATEEVITFNTSDGIRNAFMEPEEIIKHEDGSFFMENGMGLLSFHPDSLWALRQRSVDVIIQQLDIIGEDTSILNPGLAPESIVLRHNQNFIKITYQGIQLPTAEGLRYSYLLEGFHKDWIYAGSNREITMTNVPPGKYQFQVKTGKPDSFSPASRFSLMILKPFWQQVWFIILVCILIGGSIISIFRWRINQIKKREALKANYNKKIAELELHALRSQMNPHFMFNSLNAIKSYILQADQIDAAQYLTRFAHLIRMILQHSREQTISLAEELESLILYIDLEKLRFAESFDFTCKIEDNIQLESIRIPPLIMQPYVENAIWHGLMHKKGDASLSIGIRNGNDVIQCIIEDNGIGRKRSMELNSRSALNYKSMGMGITRDRIDIHNKMNNPGIDVEIIDKQDDQGNSLGTKVVIQIPQDHNEINQMIS